MPREVILGPLIEQYQLSYFLWTRGDSGSGLNFITFDSQGCASEMNHMIGELQ
jgi:hypothetical protein